MPDPIVEPPSRPSRRVTIAIAANADDRFSVLTVQPFAQPSPPNGDRLAGWVSAGWMLARLPHGNLGRGTHIDLRKGTSQMDVAQAVLGIEVDGKHFRVSVRDVLTADVDEPDDWKTFAGWTAEGWQLSSLAGNLQHGGLVVMQKPLEKDDDKPDDDDKG